MQVGSRKCWGKQTLPLLETVFIHTHKYFISKKYSQKFFKCNTQGSRLAYSFYISIIINVSLHYSIQLIFGAVDRMGVVIVMH